MGKEGFGVARNDRSIGAEILARAALSDEFADAKGKYFDHDEGRFNPPRRDVLNRQKCDQIVLAIEAILTGAT